MTDSYFGHKQAYCALVRSNTKAVLGWCWQFLAGAGNPVFFLKTVVWHWSWKTIKWVSESSLSLCLKRNVYKKKNTFPSQCSVKGLDESWPLEPEPHGTSYPTWPQTEVTKYLPHRTSAAGRNNLLPTCWRWHQYFNTKVLKDTQCIVHALRDTRGQSVVKGCWL